MANKDTREGSAQTPIQKKKQPSPRKGKTGEAASNPNFYRAIFSPEEHADLALMTEKDLEDEIALLKVLIRRGLQVIQADDKKTRQQQADGETIRRCIDTLCRAIRIQCSLRGKQDSEIEEATKSALAELADELEITLQAIPPTKGVSSNDDIEQGDNQHDAQDGSQGESRG